ncbi:Zn-dependent protease [Ignicoccus pacificus DSM 13166]|uniref:Zn-dependent protease n=1 Tax=Ignicoccus pacificus DSM 13166 TaxID=940294 RepID=A0A977K8Z4_9CREN|nr:Zn-dependent protease [Ignicoccus pacificus DSM 13166]
MPSSLPSEGESLEAARRVVEEGWKRGVKAEVLIFSFASTRILGSKEEIKIASGEKWVGAVRVNGSGIAYSTNPQGLFKALEEAIKASKMLGEIPLAPLDPLVDRVTQRLEVPPWDVPLEQKVKDVRDSLKDVEGSITLNYRESYGYKLYLSYEGREILQRLSYTLHAASVTLSEGGNRGNGYWSDASRRGYTTDPFKVVQKAYSKAKNQLRGKSVEPGTWDVVLMPPAIGVMVHEALGHMSEADHVKAGSPLKLGEKVASDVVSVSDSPGSGEEWGSIFYDDEGVKPKKVEILKEGVVSGFLTDRQHAKELNLPLTGNGRVEEPGLRILPRMRVTYLEPGDWDEEELIREMKRGLLIYDTSGGNAENDGTFFFMSQEAWYVENGEKVFPLRPMGMSGNVLEMLKFVRGVGKRLEFRPGTCGKWGQSVPVSVGGGAALTKIRVSPV